MKQTHLCDIVFFVLSPVLCLGDKAIKSLKVDSVRLDVAWQSSRAVQDRVKLVQCMIRVTDCFKVVVAFHQGSALRLFLFAVVLDRFADGVRLCAL